MRNWFVWILVILTLLMAGCGAEPFPQTTAPGETTVPATTEAVMETTVPAATTIPAETKAPATGPSTEVPTESVETAASLPYLQRIDRVDQSIFDGPGYDYVFRGTVRERGTYTIVEELWDYEGNLWGKLKSGAGWVDLTEIRSGSYASALISANYADENLILHGAYHHHDQQHHSHHQGHHDHGTESCIPIAIRAYGKLRNVELCPVILEGDAMVLGEAFFTLPEMDETMPLVAELAFPGDMSMYGIRFVDENGVTHVYEIYISGRNGALMLARHEP